MTHFAVNPYADEIIIKTANETVTSSATLQDDNHLFFSADANTNYEITVYLITQCSSTVPDFKFGFTNLASAAWMAGGHGRDVDTGGGFSTNIIPETGGNTTTARAIQFSSTGDRYLIHIDASYVTQGTSGTVYFRWSQNTSNATGVTIIADSYMEVKKIGTNP